MHNSLWGHQKRGGKWEVLTPCMLPPGLMKKFPWCVEGGGGMDLFMTNSDKAKEKTLKKQKNKSRGGGIAMGFLGMRGHNTTNSEKTAILTAEQG